MLCFSALDTSAAQAQVCPLFPRAFQCRSLQKQKPYFAKGFRKQRRTQRKNAKENANCLNLRFRYTRHEKQLSCTTCPIKTEYFCTRPLQLQSQGAPRRAGPHPLASLAFCRLSHGPDTSTRSTPILCAGHLWFVFCAWVRVLHGMLVRSARCVSNRLVALVCALTVCMCLSLASLVIYVGCSLVFFLLALCGSITILCCPQLVGLICCLSRHSNVCFY